MHLPSEEGLRRRLPFGEGLRRRLSSEEELRRSEARRRRYRAARERGVGQWWRFISVKRKNCLRLQRW